MGTNQSNLSTLPQDMGGILMKSKNKNILLYDDDCGICTKFSSVLGKILGTRVILQPMHDEKIMAIGISSIGDDYWQSFHIVQNGKWTTEAEAIHTLAGIFPFGEILQKVVKIPLVSSILMTFLHLFQRIRKQECGIL
jgi:predicted DCC family thiol-disulfide oxidoreductase YuxK